MKKPLIGVLPLYDTEKESFWMLPGYLKGIEDAGGVPVILPLTSDEEVILQLAKQCDGFLFTGGHDVNPSMYGEQTEKTCGETCPERDTMENLLLKYVIELDKPALGICRGLQLWNVVLGGTLYQDLPTQRHSAIIHKQKPPYTEPIHTVTIEKDTLLYEILQTDSLNVNSYHHQGIKNLSNRLQVAAHAQDGLIEAVIMLDKKFMLAVQWHPEFIYTMDTQHFQLFLAFVESCE